MIEPAHLLQWRAFDDQLRAIIRARHLLLIGESALPTHHGAPHWVGPAQQEFAANLLTIRALWSTTLDSLAEAEHDTRRAIAELESGNR